jgi:phosphoribosyl 1,2-cyclic phosphodiesterase
LITIHTIASGSEGNCLLVTAGSTHILVDAGISCRRIGFALGQLGLSIGSVAAVLITHEHGDHICGLQTMVRRWQVPIYTGAATGRQLRYRVAGIDPQLRAVEPGEPFTVGEITVTAFPTSHDVAGGLDYRFDCGGAAAGVLTDTGTVTGGAEEILRGVELLVLESNHDVDRLLSGPYPFPLKRRILSDFGHLSNDAAAAFAARLAGSGTRQFVLAHLSQENNTPALALEAVSAAVAPFGASVTVAPRGRVSEAYVAEGGLCRR